MTIDKAMVTVLRRVVHGIAITPLQLRTTNQQVHWVVQVIPYVSKGRSHEDCRLEARYGYLVNLSQEISDKNDFVYEK